MNYFLIKLSFDTAVHFGMSDTAQSLASSEDHLHADTMFSALCHTALQLYGEEGIEQLISWTREGKFLLSDTMPWREGAYYLPKPFILSDTRKELPTSQAKAMKKLPWIPVCSFREFSESVHGGEPYDPGKYGASFGFQVETTRIAVFDGADALPYQVGLFQFAENCGLYLIVGLETKQQETMLHGLVRTLGMGGIGGKISTGCGKFHVEETVLLNACADEQSTWLYRALTKKSGRYLLLSTSLPRAEELDSVLEGATYQLVRRSGFVASDTYAERPVKKKTQYFLQAGSVVQNRFEGDLYAVGSRGAHPVYRYGKPLFLGVDL